MNELATPPGNRPSDDSVILRVEGLTVDFVTERGPVTVVRDVSMDLRRGETLGLVGESGSGKTVTGLSVLGLLPPSARVTSGRILFDGRDLLAEPPSTMRRTRGRDIAMIFQEPRRSLDPCFSIGDQVAEAIRSHHDVSRSAARQQAIEMLGRVQIPDARRRSKQYPHEFSGGQCQRVMLAVALACRPRILIADEPTTALDVTVQKAMLKLLADLQGEMDLSILLVTHDLGVVAETCDRVAVMYAGEVVEQASAVELFDAPRHPYSQGLLRSISQMTDGGRRLISIPGVVPSAHDWPQGCRFHPRCDHVVDACHTSEAVLVDLGPGRVSRCLRADELAEEGNVSWR